MKFAKKVSSHPRKKRLALYNAPLHTRQKLVAVHLGRDLRKQLKKRSLSARKGDKVVVLRGKFKKKEGSIARVDLNRLKIFVEGLFSKSQRGKESLAPLAPSLLVLTQLVERKKKAKPQKTQAQKALVQASKTQAPQAQPAQAPNLK